MITLIDALDNLGISAYCKNNDYDTIVWTNPEEAVSKEVLNAKVAEMQSAEDATQYQRDRLQEYPTTNDLIVALWEKVVEGRSESADALEVKRQQVKTAHPKSE